MLSASAHAQAVYSCHGMQAVTREDFLLPTLGAKLEAFREEVRTGRGFQLFRCTHLTLSFIALMADDLDSKASAVTARVQLAWDSRCAELFAALRNASQVSGALNDVL